LKLADPTALVQYGHGLLKAGRLEEAYQVAQQVQGMELLTGSLHDAMGALWSRCDEPGRALRFFERAVQLEPANSLFLYNLATAHRMLGDLDAAEAGLRKVIRRNPRDISAYHLLSDLRTQTADSNHIDSLEALLRTVRGGSMDEVILRFALAKELEDIHAHARSFEHLRAGCSVYRRMIQYDVGADVRTLERLIELHRPESLQSGADCSAVEAIFVLGLPRTGTTLVDRILSGHSRLTSIGESMAFPLACIRAVRQGLEGSPTKLEFVMRSLQTDPVALGRSYVSSIRATRAPSEGRFVDKQPMNLLYAGLIRRSLPRALFVLIERDPMDACYAMFKTLFTGAHPYSYDLGELAHYYAAWHRLARHWQEVLGERLLLIRYEDLVAHPEDAARRLISHCGLSWESACLDFHRQREAVTTASAVQVRSPIYSSSVGKWTHYREQLEPLRRALERLEPSGGWH
jgi:tetratricopeptide (TPR) repeat protein